jgi:hypothetical protein
MNSLYLSKYNLFPPTLYDPDSSYPSYLQHYHFTFVIINHNPKLGNHKSLENELFKFSFSMDIIYFLLPYLIQIMTTLLFTTLSSYFCYINQVLQP